MQLWDFGRARREIREAEISTEQSETDLHQTERDIIIEVRATVRDVKTTIERKRLLEIALRVAEENYSVAVSRFESGSISSQRLLDAQLSLFRARTNLLSARVDLDLALRRLQKVTLARLDELAPGPNE
jgi:outer membrane protein TolC